MSPYLLFGGPSYYPQGGWADLLGSFPGLDEATSQAREICARSDRFYSVKPQDPEYEDHMDIDWWHIVHNGDVVLLGNREVRKPRREDPAQVWWEETKKVWWET